jgi:hypothetical protein
MIEMLKIIKCGMLIAALFFMGKAHASCNADSCEITSTDPMKRIYLTSIAEGQIYIEVPSGGGNLDCTLRENKFMTLKSSHPLFKETYSALLSGSMAGKRMSIRIKNGSDSCEIAYVMVYF